MTIGAKQSLLRDAEKALGSILTAEQLANIMPKLGDCLAGYEVEQIISDPGVDDLLDTFLAAKAVEGRSDKTAERYAYIIRRFLHDVKTETSRVTVYHIRQYLLAEKQRGISDSTLGSYRSIFSSYFGWLHKEGLIRSNPCANLNAIKCAKVVREPYSSEDIERLREACKTIRDRALLAFLLSTGCRISEICSLNRDDVDFQSLECTVLGKGNKERVVYVDAVAAMLLKRYLASRKDSNPALFIGIRAERLLPGGVRVMLKQLEAKTGVQNVHPHRFRRTLATNLISRGMAIQEVAAILGHDKLDTTMRYVYLDKTAVKNSYRKYAS